MTLIVDDVGFVLEASLSRAEDFVIHVGAGGGGIDDGTVEDGFRRAIARFVFVDSPEGGMFDALLP